MEEVKRIGIAVVESAGRFLVGIRPAGVPLAGLSEFPGGKCEPDEAPRACAVRECREETGLIIIPGHQLATVPWTYPHGSVELHFWQCHPAPDLPPCARVLPPFEWITREELLTREFPPANQSVLEELTRRIA